MSSKAAQSAKEKGNTAFKTGQYPEAIGFYTEALLADRSDPTYPLNRAAAYLKLGKFEDAEKDCSTVLRLKPDHVKGLFRRAQARIELKKYDDARKDLSDALKLEPSNDAIKTELGKLDTFVTNVTKPRKAPLDASASAPKRRRVPIEIVDAPPRSVDSSPTSNGTTTAVSSQTTPSVQNGPSSGSSSNLTRPSEESTNSNVSNSSKVAQPGRDNRPNVAGGIFRPSGSHTVVRSPPPQTEAQGNASSAPQVAPASKMTGPQSTDIKNNRPSLNGAKPTPSPITLLDFTNGWLSRSSREDRWKLWSSIPPSSLPSLFQSSLEASLFVSILEVLRDALNSRQTEDIAKIQSYLEWFTKVPRFSTLLLFLSSDEKAIAREVLHAASMDGVWRL